MQESERAEKALGLVGLAARAGRTVVGVSLICTALQQSKAQRPQLLLMASDASGNTQKRLNDKSVYYGVRLIILPVDCERLALAVGKRDSSVAAVGVTEPHLALAIEELYNI